MKIATKTSLFSRRHPTIIHPAITPSGLAESVLTFLGAPAKGSALMIAIVALTMLLIVGASLSSLNTTATQRMSGDKTRNQLIYITNSGIQEAIARRFFPRSNFEAFLGTSTAPLARRSVNSNNGFYLSGQVFTDVANASQVIGIYRYFILAGNPAQSRVSGDFELNDINFSIMEAYMSRGDNPALTNQPFIVISQAAICEQSPQTISVDSLSWQNSGAILTCPEGQALRRLTAVAEVNTYTTPNRTTQIRYFNDNEELTLPFPTTLPNGNIVNTMNFDDFWNTVLNGGGNLLTPMAVVFYPPVSDLSTVVARDVKTYTINGINTNLPVDADNLIPVNTLIRIIFNGAFNPQTVSSANVTLTPTA
ncbi:MAG: hypothetical protein VKK59_00865, partial [Vampirovibrionales bacterium]|nr:hypothetical protein [Vampirovibrionales bacterium]